MNMNGTADKVQKGHSGYGTPENFRFLFFSELKKKPICAGKIKDRIGRLTDIVFSLTDPYPEAVGIYLEYGWGKPTQFIPWDRVLRIEDDAIFVMPPESGDVYPPFVDKPGWILLNNHLMGKTILDMDGRRIEVVNDVHLLVAKNRMALVHVDTSFNGFLRRLGIRGLRWIKDNFISWKYVQPLSMEDAVTTDKVSLSVTRKQLIELPSEDLADALEELSGKEQEALFSALDSEKAAETLMETEPRARRQIIGKLRSERAKQILSEMTIPQLANLFSVLPHDDVTELLQLLPDESAERITNILSEREAKAGDLIGADFLFLTGVTNIAQTLETIRKCKYDKDCLSYIYVVGDDNKTLIGVVDLRDLVLADTEQKLQDIMISPVVSAEEDYLRDDLVDIFRKYHYRMVPVVDHQDHLLGIIKYSDIMTPEEKQGDS